GEKHNDLRDLFGPPDALERHARDEGRLAGVRAGKPGEHAGIDRTRGHHLTRTPDPAASSAADWVRPSTACLLAAYTAAPAPPRWPKVEDTLMMLPRPCASITRSSCFMLRSVPSTLVSKVAA